jgi:2-polyprenyl-3-methyl-5-hydroxy-6-metoxy-1,4-benzoquinol methylase
MGGNIRDTMLIKCYNCGSHDNRFYASENGFTLVKCKECGLLFVDDPPSDQEIMHAHSEGIHGGLEELKVTGSFSDMKVKRYANILEDFFGNGESLNGKTWLDIGCGHGEFLAALEKFGRGSIAAKGIEPNVYKQKSAKEKGLDVSYLDLNSHDDTYDIVSFLNVYSHLPDPPATILSWKSLLTPHGEFFLQTGDTADFESKDHFRPFYLPDHLSFASEKIVVNILERSGFEIVSLKKYPFLQLTLKALVKDLIKALLPNYTSQLKWLLKGKLYRQADMFIRARLKS